MTERTATLTLNPRQHGGMAYTIEVDVVFRLHADRWLITLPAMRQAAETLPGNPSERVADAVRLALDLINDVLDLHAEDLPSYLDTSGLAYTKRQASQ